ncbi:amino acid adenylation domain-containing protein [Streptomyces sp. NPDC048297]|uniref:amino acid adenylation domain-containing protein n=1 Tax=Streptomyces sp. NPDC048297 TaxID=3365531 RepID=UPI00371D32D7
MADSRQRRLSSGSEYDTLLDSLRGHSPWAVTRPVPAPPSRADTTDTAPDEPGPWESVGESVARRCAHSPTAPAVYDSTTEVSYGELGARVDALATALVDAGVGKGDIVALVFDRGVEFVVAALATWRAGAAYLPLSPTHPETWLTDATRRAGAVLGLGKPVPGLPHLHEPLAAIDLSEAPAPAGPREVAGAVGSSGDPNGPGDLAYVIATSGSTGVPKLVMIEHGGLANLVRAQRASLGTISARSRVLQFGHPAFDAATFDILLALANGARLVVPGEKELSGDTLADLLVTRGVTHAVVSAAVLRTLRPGGFPDLQVLVSMGDVCLPETARQWAPHHRFINGYGPTETTICATVYTATGAESTRVPIGRPVPGYSVVLLDEHLEPVPAGAVGEICIGGAGVGRGYLGDPELTARRFVELPGVGRVYRSGDLGRLLPDGTIEFLGRADDQVKVRGVRIELGQVEAALAAQPGVRDALAVVDRPGDHGAGHGAGHTGEARLLGYVIGDVDPAALRAALARELPGYLVPDQVVVVGHWPLTVSGKVDRAALPRPGNAARSVQGPRDDTEACVVEVASELLGIPEERIDVDDDLFELGGNSLLAAQLVARLRTRLGAEVAVRSVLEGRSPAAIAARIGSTAGDTGPRPGGDGPPQPSYGQRRVWLMHGLNPDSRAYHSQSVFRLAGELSIESLEASLTEIVRTQDVLRSRFPVIDGELTCVIDEPWPVRLDIRDLTGSADPSAAVGTAVRELLEAPFDLEHAPPFRWGLLRLGDEEHVFVHIEHHVVHDGWSFRVFVRDLLDGYSEHLEHGTISRAAPAVSYYDYTRWQQEWLSSPEADAQRAFWRAELDGAETVLRLPRRTQAPATRFLGRTPRLDIDAMTSQRLADLAEQCGTTLYNTLLAAFFVLLHTYTGSRDLLVGSAVADRRWQQTENLLGMFVNNVVFRGRFDGDPTFVEFLDRIRERSHAVYDHQELPYDLIFAESQAARGDGARPLVQAMFNFHDSPLGALRPTPLETSIVEGLGNGSAKFDISVVGVPRYAQPGRISQLGGDLVTIPRSTEPVLPSARTALEGITLAWEFDTDMFDEFFCAHMLTAYETLLRSLLDAPDTPVSQLDLLDGATRSDLLTWGRGRTTEPPSSWLPDLVARWVRETPEALALDGPTQLNYAQLDAASARIARHLRGLGVGRGDVVGVRVPHAPEMVVAHLGVIRSGAACLPLDPADPPARAAALMADCGATTMLTAAALACDAPEHARTVVVEDIEDAPADAAGEELPRGEASDAGYILYTSGSSGVPKGVIIEHRSVASRAFDDEVTGVTAQDDTVLAVASPSFDLSVQEMWSPLVHGATARVLPRPWHLADVADELKREEVTRAFLSAAVFNELAMAYPDAFDGMRRVASGGDIIAPEAVAAMRERGVRHVTNGYGPTETTIYATVMSLEDWPADAGPGLPIGRPTANTSVYVLDEQLRLLPPGAVGEICIGGVGVARGYTRPGNRFVPNPFDDGTLYRTGDRGRWLDGGVLDFAGRGDTQVKIRGFRVEPAEVRAALLSLPQVRDAVVLVDRDEHKLVGHVLSTRTGADIRRALAEVLPRHLVPSVVVPYDSFPLNANGKVDVPALSKAPLPRTEYEAPRTPWEEVIAQAVTDVCGVRPGIHENLYDLGMHSLQAMRLVSRISATTGRPIGLATVLLGPTVAELAAAVEATPPEEDTITRVRR